MQRALVITTGNRYVDIDGLACAIAYKKLQDLLGNPAKVVLEGPLNESVSKNVRAWSFDFEPNIEGNPKDFSYSLVDISDPSKFASFVVLENIVEIFDHRWGLENYWKEKLGENMHIEMVGSCATLIWEQYKKHNLADKIDSVSANLLYTAIVSNTLNFKAKVTTERDNTASTELQMHVKVSENWIAQYFSEIEASALNDPVSAIKNDTKKTTINNVAYSIGQLELWDNTEFLTKHSNSLKQLMKAHSETASFITLPNISQGFNYIICEQPKTQQLLTKSIDVKFEGFIGKTKSLWLRKEIMRELG